MASKQDYYDLLGIPRTASKDDIKKAFRKLARQYHPDVNKNDEADERFKEINEAYEVLSDDQKRAAYDRFGHAGMRGSEGGFQDFSGNMNDIFEEIFGGFGSRRQQRGPRRGNDLRYDLTISFEEAIFGVEKEIEVRRPETCPNCYGSGSEPGTHPQRCSTCNGSGEVRRVQQSILGSFVNVTTCPACRGEGEVIVNPCQTCSGRKQIQQSRRLKVRVPAGVSSEQQIRLTGEGGPGANGGPPGNLYVFLNVRRHEIFQRRNNDILMNLEINIAQAALGDEVMVPTVDGEVEIAIPHGTQSGAVIRLRGLGVPHLGGSGRGDQLVMVQVAIPDRLSDRQRELFNELSKTLGKEVVPKQEKGFLNHLKNILGDALGL